MSGYATQVYATFHKHLCSSSYVYFVRCNSFYFYLFLLLNNYFRVFFFILRPICFEQSIRWSVVCWLEEYSYFSWQIMTSKKKITIARPKQRKNKNKKNERAQQARVQQKEITVILLHLMKNSLFPFRSNLLGEDWFSFRIFDFVSTLERRRDDDRQRWPQPCTNGKIKCIVSNKCISFERLHVSNNVTCVKTQ